MNHHGNTEFSEKHPFKFVSRRGKNVTLVCFLWLLERERKKRLTLAAYSFCLETPGLPACYPLRAFRKQYTS